MSVREPIAIAPRGRYLAFRFVGLALIILDCVGIILLLYFIGSGAVQPMAIFVLVVAVAGFYFVSFWACSRRAKVYENGIVPSYLPFTMQFTLSTPFLRIDDISEIRNVFAGRRVIGIGFEMNDGKRYYVSRSEVGEEVFSKFLEFKRRYYST